MSLLLFFYLQEVKALREETAQEENRYHYINSMSEAGILKRLFLKAEKNMLMGASHHYHCFTSQMW